MAQEARHHGRLTRSKLFTPWMALPDQELAQADSPPPGLPSGSLRCRGGREDEHPSGHSIRLANPCEEPWIHAGGRGRDRAWHRCEQHDVHHLQRGAVQDPSVREPPADRPHPQSESRRGLGQAWRVLRGFPGVSRAGPIVRGARRLHGQRLHHQRRTRRTAPDRGVPGDAEYVFADRTEAAART